MEEKCAYAMIEGIIENSLERGILTGIKSAIMIIKMFKNTNPNMTVDDALELLKTAYNGRLDEVKVPEEMKRYE